MEILQIVGIGLIGAILAVFVKERNKEIALLISMATGLLIFLFAVSKVSAVIKVLEELASRANINMFYLTTVLKIIGIAYIAEFGAQVCKDAGEGSIATKIELAAKILVMVLALPIIVAILESVLRLIP
ncbi:MAG: stage III sporulation protein AD [Bacillota bacterium]|uniref:Stage III sporulation protein AD n=1 Tax=Thermanaerosceptrum fracticalcis TaxID=1712410 RepID=A0A7G6E0C3_THEFR|nr:stage III sporulation protein AD [Thermanaerosceptrum fracticalcis]QNB45527.1 stage III sporulation protein AD [Thermanaerosceptrum fracticalcis]